MAMPPTPLLPQPAGHLGDPSPASVIWGVASWELWGVQGEGHSRAWGLDCLSLVEHHLGVGPVLMSPVLPSARRAVPHWQHAGRRAGPKVPPLPTAPNPTAPLSHPAEDAREKGSRKAAELGECSRGPKGGSTAAGWAPRGTPWADGLLSVSQIRRWPRTATSTRWALSHARRPLSAAPPSSPPRCCTPWSGSMSCLSGSSPRSRCPAGRVGGCGFPSAPRVPLSPSVPAAVPPVQRGTQPAPAGAEGEEPGPPQGEGCTECVSVPWAPRGSPVPGRDVPGLPRVTAWPCRGR